MLSKIIKYRLDLVKLIKNLEGKKLTKKFVSGVENPEVVLVVQKTIS